MTRLGALSLTLWMGIGLSGCSLFGSEDEVQHTALRACDSDHESTLNVTHRLDGAMRAIALGNDGYLLFARGNVGEGLLRLGASGGLLERIPNPSDLAPRIMDAARFDDDSLLLTGLIENYSEWDGSRGWVGRLDAEGTRAWELEVGPQPTHNVAVRALSDGSAIVAAVGSAGPSPEPDSEAEARGETVNGVVSWMRLSRDGDVLWERSLELEGPISSDRAWWGTKFLTLGPEQSLRLVVQSQAGLVLITSDWEGQGQEQTLLETRLTGGLVGTEVLPDGRLAILSGRAAAVLTLVDSDGSVLFEQIYGRLQSAQPEALAYHAEREELIIGGSFRGDDQGSERTWIIGVDLEGTERWSITRKPLGRLGSGETIQNLQVTQGPAVTDLAIAPNGRFLASGSSRSDLSYFIIDPEGCHD
jgi:hypothetical protein